jgi:predicted RNase H-like HicB family nuclease
MAHLKLTAIFEPVEDGWIQARIEQLPGVITAAPTAELARDMLADALVEYLASFAGEAPPDAPGARRETLDLRVG